MGSLSKLDIFIGPHAAQRIQQRGIKPSVARMIITLADREIHVGGGRTSLTVTKRRAKQLREQGQLSPSQAEQIAGKAVVISNDNDGLSMVTVMHVHDGKRGRHYRKSVKPGQNSKRRQR